jgi:hypothetical protein
LPFFRNFNTLKGDAFVLDSNRNGKIDKDDTVVRVPNLSSTIVNVDENYVAKFLVTKVRGTTEKIMTLKELFTNLTGDGSVENNFHGFTLDKTPLKSFFENATPPPKSKKK